LANKRAKLKRKNVLCYDQKLHQIAMLIFRFFFRSKLFLTSIWKEPCINLSQVNPIAYRYMDELRKLLPIRVKLSAVYPYVSTCRYFSAKELISM